MGFFILIGVVVCLLWITAGFRAYEQDKKDKTSKLYFLHLLIALGLAFMGMAVVGQIEIDCTGDLSCSIDRFILSGLIGTLVLLIYPIVLLFVWRPKTRNMRPPREN